MFKKIWLILAIAVFAASAAHAVPDRTGKWDLGVNVSGAIPDDSEVDSTVAVGGQLAYGVTNWLALGVEAGWAEFEETEGIFVADETAVGIFGDIILRVPMPDGQVQPYGIIGLGVLLWDVDTNVPGLDIDVDDAFAAKFGGGLDWFINENWILNFEFSYVTSDADATATFNGASLGTAEGETDFWLVGGGVKYLFG